MRNIIVTGGAGFIGTNLVRFLLENENDIKVINLDKLTYSGNLGNLTDIMDHPRHSFIKADICDQRAIRQIFNENEIEGILNLAAESHVDRSINDSMVFIQTNVMGTQVLLSEARRAGVKRFLQVSTDEVYGSLGRDGRFSEDSVIQPNSPYSASKAGGDHLVRASWKTYGFDCLITRCSNNYGPYQFPEKMIPLMINNAREDRPLPVYGDGLNIRDWIHVHDHCRAVWSVYCSGRAGEVYNIGGGNERTNLEVVERILELMDKPKSLISYVKDRPGHDRRYAIDTAKIQRELKWEPKTDFAEGLSETIQWYKDSREWLNEVLSGEYREYYRQMYDNR